MVIVVYTTSVSADKLVKKHQQHILDVLTAKGVKHREVDVSAPENDEAKQFMRKHARADTAEPAKVPVPPQIFTEDGQYLGDYDAFVDANETNELEVFLKLADPLKVSAAAVHISPDQKPAAEDGATQIKDDAGRGEQEETEEIKSEKESGGNLPEASGDIRDGIESKSEADAQVSQTSADATAEAPAESAAPTATETGTEEAEKPSDPQAPADAAPKAEPAASDEVSALDEHVTSGADPVTSALAAQATEPAPLPGEEAECKSTDIIA